MTDHCQLCGAPGVYRSRYCSTDCEWVDLCEHDLAPHECDAPQCQPLPDPPPELCPQDASPPF